MSAIALLAVTIVCVSVANLSLRHGMSGLQGSGLRALVLHALRQRSIYLGGVLYAISMVTWLGALRDLPLGLAYPVYFGGSFAMVLLGAAFLLGEDVTPRRFVGVLAIFAGITISMP